MRGSFLTFLVIVALVFVGVLGQMGMFVRETPRYEPERPSEVPRRPRLAEPETEGLRPLPAPSPADPTIDIAIPYEAQSATGTGFSLDGRGLWMTARHVADGCSRLFVMTGPRSGYRVSGVYIHPSADVAILRTDRGAQPVALSNEPPRVNQTAYHFGFPRGEPGAVVSVLLGRATMRARGRYRTIEPVLVWAEKERIPEGDEHLGGISGGPVFDSAGRVIGTTVAGSTRRGRVFTSDMSSIRAALARAKVAPADESSAVIPSLNLGNWIQVGAALRRQLTVAKIICIVDQPQVWGPRGFGQQTN